MADVETDMSVHIRECHLGKGLFAGRIFGSGDPILAFGGAIIDAATVQSRGEREADALQICRGMYIDLTPPGVYVNHSCEPNAAVTFGGTTLVAVRQIDVGDEILFDYSTTILDDPWWMECRCGASRCRGTIGEFKSLPLSVQRKYLAAGIVPGFIARSHHGDTLKLDVDDTELHRRITSCLTIPTDGLRHTKSAVTAVQEDVPLHLRHPDLGVGDAYHPPLAD